MTKRLLRYVWDGNKWAAMGAADYKKHSKKMEKIGAKFAVRTEAEHKAIVNSK